MDRFKLNHSLQTTACFALGSLISGNDDIRRQIMENGGIMRILNAITRQYPPNQQSVLSAGRRLKQVVTTFDDHQFTTDYDDDTAENDENAGDDDDVDDESESREVIDPETVNDYEDDENSGDDDASSIDQISGGPLSATIRGGKQAAGKGQSLTRSLLLQLFGCVALFNMSENGKSCLISLIV
jgi:hypothetical protein